MTTSVPIHFLFAVGDNLLTLAWCEIEADEFEYIRDNPRYYQFFVFQGKTAKIIVCTPNGQLDRQKALKMARNYMSGEYEIVDLRICGGRLPPSTKKPKPHPPY